MNQNSCFVNSRTETRLFVGGLRESDDRVPDGTAQRSSPCQRGGRRFRGIQPLRFERVLVPRESRSSWADLPLLELIPAYFGGYGDTGCLLYPWPASLVQTKVAPSMPDGTRLVGLMGALRLIRRNLRRVQWPPAFTPLAADPTARPHHPGVCRRCRLVAENAVPEQQGFRLSPRRAPRREVRRGSRPRAGR